MVAVVVTVAFALFFTQAVPVEVTCLGILASLSLTGVLSPEETLSGFSSTATVTVALVLVLSEAVVKTGLAELLASLLGHRAFARPRVSLVVMGAVVAFLSAFMNNTAVVALAIPVVLSLSARAHVPPSKLLLPVSYFAILGGTCTLIGTSTNLVVDSVARAHGGPGFTLFEFTPLGVIGVVVGVATAVLLTPLLPQRVPLSMMISRSRRSQFVTEVSLPPGSRYVGRPLGELAAHVEVLELFRGEESIVNPPAHETLRAGDTLLVQGEAGAIRDLLSGRHVVVGTAVADDERVAIERLGLMVTEMVITPTSRFAGVRLQDAGLRRHHGILVLAARRLGMGHHIFGLRRMVLRPGDVLLVQGPPHDLDELHERGDVLLIEGTTPWVPRRRKAPLALAIFAGVVVLAALRVAPLVPLGLVGVGVILATQCLGARDALHALDSGVLLLLACASPLATAMTKTGLAAEIASGVTSLSGGSPWLTVSLLALATSLLTEVVSNNATAALLAPVALAVAGESGFNPKAALMAVVFGASSSFATPIGYQTNAMVMGAGGYLFQDYLKVGLPMKVVVWGLVSALIPVFWPLTGG